MLNFKFIKKKSTFHRRTTPQTTLPTGSHQPPLHNGQGQSPHLKMGQLPCGTPKISR